MRQRDNTGNKLVQRYRDRSESTKNNDIHLSASLTEGSKLSNDEQLNA